MSGAVRTWYSLCDAPQDSGSLRPASFAGSRTPSAALIRSGQRYLRLPREVDESTLKQIAFEERRFAARAIEFSAHLFCPTKGN